jgi:hypothetical protein
MMEGVAFKRAQPRLDWNRFKLTAMPWSPKIPIAPGTSWDGHHGASKYWGKRSRMVKMCPHVKPGGGQCGLEAAHCMCMCLLCQAPMSARKRCRRKQPDGTICPWGADRSPEVSSPEQEPEYNPVPRKIPWHRGLVPSTPPGRVPSDDVPVRYSSPVVRRSPLVSPVARRSPLVYPAAVSEQLSPGICLPNLEPGGPGYLPLAVWRQRTPPTPKEVAKVIAAFTPRDPCAWTSSDDQL